jgi:2-polyprenyl-3-methyl-5-hydroxy-6-metoxy-1,4-benzoquinol methylase
VTPGEGKGPSVAVFVVAYNAVTTLTKVLDRIPAEVWDSVAEVYVFDDASTDETAMLSRAYKHERGRTNLNVFRNETNRGYGGNQKLGYRYAIEKGYDVVVLLHGDGQYAPEVLPEILGPLLEGRADAVMGSRMTTWLGALRGGMPLYKYAGNIVLSSFQNLVLDTQLSEFHSGYRAYRVAALKAVPFERNTDDFHFDTEILIQLLARGFRIAEVPIPTYYGDEISRVNGWRYAREVVRATLDYRRHRAGLKRVPKYEVDGDRYPAKLDDPYSSHSKILARVPPGARVLEVGCGSGALGEALRARGCRVTGVDAAEPASSGACDAFVKQDLDRDPDLPRDPQGYDIVLLADVLEHVRRPEAILASARPALAPGGRLLASTGNIAHLWHRLSLLLGRFEYAPRGILDESHVHLYTLGAFRRLIEGAGFHVTRVDATPVPLPALHPMFGRAPLSWLHALGHALSRAWKRMFAYQFILEAEPIDGGGKPGQ